MNTPRNRTHSFTVGDKVRFTKVAEEGKPIEYLIDHAVVIDVEGEAITILVNKDKSIHLTEPRCLYRTGHKSKTIVDTSEKNHEHLHTIDTRTGAYYFFKAHTSVSYSYRLRTDLGNDITELVVDRIDKKEYVKLGRAQCFEIIGLTHSMPEDILKLLVTHIPNKGYKNYEEYREGDDEYEPCFATAKESLQSLLKYEWMRDKTYLVIKILG